MAGGPVPPYEIRTKRLLIRCWQPHDASRYKAAVDASLEQLRPWIEWAHDEPSPLEVKVQLLRRFRGLFDLGQDFQYGIFDRAGTEVVGSTGLHARGKEDVFELGYWIRADQAGRGIATETVAALTKIGFELCGVDRLEIHIAVGNDASRRVAEKLAYPLEATLRRRMPPLTAGSALRDEVVYTMFAEEYAGSPSSSAALEAYDAAGTRLL